MATFKKIDSNSISTIPYEANKQYNLEYTKLVNNCQSGSDNDVSILTGKKISTDFVAKFEPITANHYQKSVYNTINKLYYNKFSSSFDYDSNVELIKHFPTDENSFIRVIQIPQSKFGNNILPNEFKLISDVYNIRDDGFGNLYDNQIHVGNIFYNQGLAVITNQEYNCLFPIEPTIFPKNLTTFVNNQLTIDLTSDAIAYCGQVIDTQSVEIINISNGFIYSIANGVLTFNQNNIGKYFAQYYLKDGLGICSNIVDINIEIKSNCDFDIFVSGSQSQSNCISTTPDFELIRLPIKDCLKYGNDIEGYLVEIEHLNKRANGITDFKYFFNSNKKVDWKISIDGGLTYFNVATNSSKLEFSTDLVNNTLNYLKNSFLFILRLSIGESYTEYRIKANPITTEYEIDKIKEYLDINLIDKNCIYNHYKVVTNNCEITAINWSFTDEMSGVVVARDEIVLFGCRGNVIAEISSRCCATVTKVLTFNGNCIEPSCTNSLIDLEIYSTDVLNNYIIFANTNFYLKNYPNWKFFGNVEYLSNVNSNYIEIRLNNSNVQSKISYEAEDFCKHLYAEHIFNRINDIISIPTTLIPNSQISISNNRLAPESSDLSLNIYSNNNFPTNNENIQINILIQNKGYDIATNIVVKIETDPTFLLNENSLLKYNYQKYNGIYYININKLGIGEYYSIKFNGIVIGDINSTVNIKSQISLVDQSDPNSEPDNGYDNDENDADVLKLIIKNLSNTTVSTTFSCIPIIREYPYTNYTCSVYNDFRGAIIISAINPFTNNTSDLEYSFGKDVDINYQESNTSLYLDNGLYDVFVRLKNNKSCKSSTKVRVSCLNGQTSTDWILDGNTCLNN